MRIAEAVRIIVNADPATMRDVLVYLSATDPDVITRAAAALRILVCPEGEREFWMVVQSGYVGGERK